MQKIKLTNNNWMSLEQNFVRLRAILSAIALAAFFKGIDRNNQILKS